MEQLSQIRPETRPLHMVRVPPAGDRGGRRRSRSLPGRSTFPDTQWDHIGGADSWTTAALSAIRRHGGGLEEIVPADIETWCPAYATNPPAMRRAFWVGMMSALAYHESRYRPGAVGGGGQWYGLLQVLSAHGAAVPLRRAHRRGADGPASEPLVLDPDHGAADPGAGHGEPGHAGLGAVPFVLEARPDGGLDPGAGLLPPAASRDGEACGPRRRPEPTSVAEALAPAQPRLSTMGRPGG